MEYLMKRDPGLPHSLSPPLPFRLPELAGTGRSVRPRHRPHRRRGRRRGRLFRGMPPDPNLRPWNAEPPEYGDNGNLFTVEILHNGFFCGLSENLCYLSGTVDCIDNCDTDTFSKLWIAHFLKELGYEMDGRLHIYWCHPGKEMKDGLQCIEFDKDILDMTRAAKEHKILGLLIDHSNFLRDLRDDVILNGGPPLPPVISPKKIPKKVAASSVALLPLSECEEGAEEGAKSIAEEEAEEGAEEGAEEDQTSDSDSDFADSDFDVADGDDDLFTDNVDKEVKDHNEPEKMVDLEDDVALEDTDLNLREEDEHNLKHKFSVFNPQVDMNNPVFKAGLLFSNVEQLRQALTAYSVRNRVKLVKPKNDQRRLDAHCKPGCPWFLKATRDSRTGGFMIRNYAGVHTCQRAWELKSLTASFLTNQFLDEIRDNQKMDLKTSAAKVQREFNMCPNRWKLSRARKEALNIIHGDEDAQFSLLWDYGQELRRSNPGSTFFLSTNKVGGRNGKEHLATLYWSYDACKRGFLRGCRPLICIDGCHMKTKYKGQLLTAVAVDPNDCIYPLAMGLVEVECTSSWEWFLTTLKEDLNITNTSPFTIMSDKQKGLINAVQKVWPDAEHRFCVRHLYQNFQKAGHRGEVLKNNLWAISRSTSAPKREANLDKMKTDSVEAYEWVEALSPNTWIKAFFSDFPKCDLLLNNHSEVFNSYILDAREMPIMSMLDTIFYKMVQRIETKQREAAKWPGTICPKIKIKLDKFTEWSVGAFVLSAGNGLYHVRSGEFEKEYNVDIKARACDCKRWQLTGIPCHHVIACCRFDRIEPESLVHSCYNIETYMRAYEFNLVPLRSKVHWEKMNAVKVHPPLYTKVMGRPRKNRKKSQEEKQKNGGTHVTRHGLTMHCSICKRPDHNRKGHYKFVENEQVEQQQNDVQMQDAEDFDDPSILQNIIHQQTNPTLDPTNVVDTMIYRMGQEDRSHDRDTTSQGPLPDSSFIAAARAAIPAPRARETTATAAHSRGTGRASTVSSRGRGRANIPATRTASKKRIAPGAGTSGASTSTRGRGKTRRGYNTGPGSAHYLLFGDDNAQGRQTIPDLNAPVEADEVVVTQNAPAV